MLIERVRRLQREARLFPPGRVVVAVSGGADSISLLHALITLRGEFQIELHVATLDHGIRGEAGAEDVRFAQQLAAQWGVSVSSERVDVPKLIGVGNEKNLEAAARQVRYGFLVKVAREIGAGVIATGHNLDDQIETVLMHLLRGTGLAGLRGMQPVTQISKLNLGLDAPAEGITLVRPLLTMPRSEIDAYMRELRITPRHDATNDDPNYTRNQLRLELMPLLGKIAPHYREAIGRMSAVVGEDYAALLDMLPSLDEQQSIALADFLALNPALQRHLLYRERQRLFPSESALDADTLRQLQRFVTEGRSGASFNDWLHIRQGRVYFYTELPYPYFAPYLEAGTEIAVTAPISEMGNGWEMQIDGQAFDSLSVQLALPEGAQIAVRTLRRGDRYQPAGMGGKSQKLSDTFVNLKVPQVWRANIPLLTVNGEIAWFVAPVQGEIRAKVGEGFRVSDSQKGSTTVNVCFVRVINQ